MKIDMTPVLSGKTDVIPLDFTCQLEEKIYGVSFPDPVHAVGSIVNAAGYMELRLDVEVPYHTECARCLKEISGIFHLSVTRPVAGEKQLENEENDDFLIIAENQLDVSSPITEEMLFSFPSRFLCKEDCKGLCPKCGQDLNEKDCGCETKEPDPRFQILLDYLASREKDEENSK